MKSLIAFLAVLVLAYADDECHTQAENFKTCVVDEVVSTEKANMEKLKGFQAAIEKCFTNADISPYCKLPEHPQSKQAPPVGFTPPPQFANNNAQNPKFAGANPNSVFGACIEGANQTFQTCVSNAGVQLPQFAHPGGPGAFGPPGGAHDHFFPGGGFNPELVKNMTLKICNNNEAAAKALLKCAFETAQSGGYLPAIIGLVEPTIVVCKAVSDCNKTKAISSECVAKFEQTRTAVCSCKSQAETFFKSDASCEKVRQFIEKAKEQSNGQVGAFPGPPPAHPAFDICGDHVNPCDELKKKMEEMKQKIDAFKAAHPASK